MCPYRSLTAKPNPLRQYQLRLNAYSEPKEANSKPQQGVTVILNRAFWPPFHNHVPSQCCYGFAWLFPRNKSSSSTSRPTDLRWACTTLVLPRSPTTALGTTGGTGGSGGRRLSGSRSVVHLLHLFKLGLGGHCFQMGPL